MDVVSWNGAAGRNLRILDDNLLIPLINLRIQLDNLLILTNNLSITGNNLPNSVRVTPRFDNPIAGRTRPDRAQTKKANSQSYENRLFISLTSKNHQTP
jgi:hypothetical protein